MTIFRNLYIPLLIRDRYNLHNKSIEVTKGNGDQMQKIADLSSFPNLNLKSCYWQPWLARTDLPKYFPPHCINRIVFIMDTFWIFITHIYGTLIWVHSGYTADSRYGIEKFASIAWENLFFSPLSLTFLCVRDISGEGAPARGKNAYASLPANLSVERKNECFLANIDT